MAAEEEQGNEEHVEELKAVTTTATELAQALNEADNQHAEKVDELKSVL